MDQGRIRTFVYYEWLLGNDTGTAVDNICRACKEDAMSQTHIQAPVQSFRERRHEPRGQGTPAEDHALLLVGRQGHAVLRDAPARQYGHRPDQLEKLAAAIREKRPRRASVHLLHDSARPHVAKETQQTTLGWETVAHPPYSPDLAPSDYHLFRPLKYHLAGRKFTNYDNLKSVIADFFESQPRSSGRRASATCPIDGPLLWITVQSLVSLSKMSSIAEEEWREYLVRRERELNRDVDDSTRPSGRFELVPKRQQSATLADDKRRALKGDGSFNLPSNVYHSSGYASRPSELGEDPLSSVRTMRSQMRSLATRYRNSDTPVRAHLCEAACDRLSAAEGQLITMARERTGAVLVGDSRRAEQLTVEMEKVKEGAIRDSYSDLVMDKQEMRAFGVNSEWSPLPVEQPPKPSTPSPAATATRPSSVSRGATPTKRKPPRPPQGTSGTQTEASVVHKVEKKVQKMQENPPREVKKNGRLSDLAVSPMAIQPNDAQHDDPYQLPNTAGSCQFCGETAPDFGEATRIEAHYKSACMMMTKCRFCSKVVLAPQLTDHIVSRCPFVTGRMTECHACGLAVDATDDANRVKHPMCRGRAPPSGAQWCPLCAVAVDNTSHGWKQHLQTICYNNPRRNGPEIDIDPNLMVGDGRAARPSSTKSVRSMKAVAGRTIDADKLVAALQTVQLRKKQDAAKKKAAIAGKSEAVDGTQSAK